MISLLLAMASSALVAILMRFGDDWIENNMAMFVANYSVCAVLSACFTGAAGTSFTASGFEIALGLGLLSGILYLANFALMQKNISKNGVVLASAFMKLGVIIPTLMAITLLHEHAKILQLLGFALAAAAIGIIHLEKEEMEKARYKYLLVILLLVSGITDSMANIYDKTGPAELKDQYLLFTFIASGICAFLLWLKNKQGFCRWDILVGIGVGIPNYFSARFLLLALHQVPAVIVFPAYSVGTIVLVTLASVLFFRETISRQKLGAIALIFIALILLNL